MAAAHSFLVNDAQLGVAARLLRQRRGWRQRDLAARAGVSRGLVSLVERGRAGELTVAAVRLVASALDVPLTWDAGWRRAQLDELRDAGHAALENEFKRRLERAGWDVRPEVSFNRYGDRGRIDLLAHHPVAHVVLVVEVKTLIVDVQALLGALDVKRRAAAAMARDAGWGRPGVVPAIVVAEASTARRRIAAHAALFAAYSLRGQAALGWLRRPSGVPSGILLFTKLSDANGAAVRRQHRRRVRLSTRRPSVDRVAGERVSGREPV